MSFTDVPQPLSALRFSFVQRVAPLLLVAPMLHAQAPMSPALAYPPAPRDVQVDGSRPKGISAGNSWMRSPAASR
jgi:hypothetical protein